MNIGLIGCGNISTAYLTLAPLFRHLDIVACADIDVSAAAAQAQMSGIQALAIDEMLSDSSIDLIINLTIPSAHFEVSTDILKAGKHVYSEKPYVLSLEEGVALRELARAQGKRIGSAPDTFLGAAHQNARHAVDSGRVGSIVAGSCHFMNHGMEDWHPNPDFFYQPGGGPMFDMGAYYISNLIQLIGPVEQVMAMCSQPFRQRRIGNGPRSGETVPVDVATTISTLMKFANGTHVTVSLSWDVWQHDHNRMELYGTRATLHVPDPNFFGGELRVCGPEHSEIVLTDHPFGVPNFEHQPGEMIANYRGAGLADMVDAIQAGRQHRCNDSLALHVIDVMSASIQSGETGQAVSIKTSCERPDSLDAKSAQQLLKS